MHAIPSSIAATLLQREELVAQCLREQWVEQVVMDAHRQQHREATAEPGPTMSARSVAIHSASHVIHRFAAAVFGTTTHVTPA
jgi:hypothetical protein